MSNSSEALHDVLQAHRFDEASLATWLRARLPGFDGPIVVRQFQGGQSNPTFLVSSQTRRCVLRKKPPGRLLPKAHQVEREFEIIRALGKTSVPVPTALALCEDPSVIGAAFYLMEYVDGRQFDGPALALCEPRDRKDLNFAALDVLASLHAIKPDQAGLGSFGPTKGYLSRQVERWTKQYLASSEAGEIDDLTWLSHWLRDHLDIPDETSIVHGDYRIGNLSFERECSKVAAVLDWELSTLGHPLSDLAYYCMPYHIDATIEGGRGLMGLDLVAMGIPDERAVIERYCAASGRDAISHWNVFLALSFFRLSAILHGVRARSLQGNASDANAARVGGRAVVLAAIGRRLARSK